MENFNEYDLKLNDFDLKIISDLLVKAPYDLAAPIINKINAQINTQKPSNER